MSEVATDGTTEITPELSEPGASTENPPTGDSSTVAITEMQVQLDAALLSVSKLTANNADLKKEKITEKKRANEAQEAKLLEQGKFEELANHLRTENEGLATRLTESGEIGSRLETLEAELSGYRTAAKDRSTATMLEWNDEDRSRFSELFPDHNDMNPMALSEKVSAFEKSFVTGKGRAAQPGGTGRPAETVNNGQGGSVGSQRRGILNTQLLADLNPFSKS